MGLNLKRNKPILLNFAKFEEAEAYLPSLYPSEVKEADFPKNSGRILGSAF